MNSRRIVVNQLMALGISGINNGISDSEWRFVEIWCGDIVVHQFRTIALVMFNPCQSLVFGQANYEKNVGLISHEKPRYSGFSPCVSPHWPILGGFLKCWHPKSSKTLDNFGIDTRGFGDPPFQFTTIFKLVDGLSHTIPLFTVFRS